MSTPKSILFLLGVVFLFVVTSQADVVTTKSGKAVECRVVAFKDGVFTVQSTNGSFTKVHAEKLSSISFSQPPAESARQNEQVEIVEKAREPESEKQDLTLNCIQIDDNVNVDNDLKRKWRREGIKPVAFNIKMINNTDKNIQPRHNGFNLRDINDNVYSADIFAIGSARISNCFIEENTIDAGDQHAGWVGFLVPIQVAPSECRICYEREDMRSDWFSVK